jgi:hypothetical protein
VSVSPFILERGWLTEAYGHPVQRVDMTHMDHTRYVEGAPHGVMWHYTAGCGTNLQGVIESRGYNICTFSIDRDGVIYEYLPVDYAAWHAYAASYRYIGVEHSGLPGSCDLTRPQYAASVALFAALVVWHQEHYGRVIPVTHIGGCDLEAPGFKEHADGVGCDWNPKTHTDGLAPAGWSWGQYLDDINALLEPPDEGGFLMALTDEQQQEIYDFIKQYMRGATGTGAPDAGASDQAKKGYEAGKKLAQAAKKG